MKASSPVEAYEATREPGRTFVSERSTFARSAFTLGESARVPLGSCTTGTSGEVSPPVPRYFWAMSTFVSQPSLFGTENSGSRASVAGPAAMRPAMVRTTQVSTTVRLCARTQRVSEDKTTTSGVVACVVRSLRNQTVYIKNGLHM